MKRQSWWWNPFWQIPFCAFVISGLFTGLCALLTGGFPTWHDEDGQTWTPLDQAAFVWGMTWICLVMIMFLFGAVLALDYAIK